jgi:hypothetical protein
MKKKIHYMVIQKIAFFRYEKNPARNTISRIAQNEFCPSDIMQKLSHHLKLLLKPLSSPKLSIL